MRKLTLTVLAFAAVAPITVVPAFAQSIGQVDNFEDGTTQGWLTALLGNPNPNPPVNVSTGGPDGVDDNYLLLTSNGLEGPGGKLVAINVTNWTGDFEAAGITGITMDVNNFGSDQLNLRLLFESGGPPTDLAVSTDGIIVPAGSGWTSIHFDIKPEDLTAILGTVDNALTNATTFRLFNSTGASFPGPVSTSSLGVDNIRAVPEPATIVGTLCGLGMLLRKRKHKAQQAG